MMIDRIKRIVTNKSNISTGTFTVGRLITTGLHVLTGLITVRLIEPDALGYFNQVTIVQGYLVWLGLGVFSGLSRELPFFYGKGNLEKANKLAETANFWAFLLGGGALLVFLAAGVYSLFVHKYWLGAALLANAFLSFNAFSNSYLLVTYRTKHDFAKLALIDVTCAVFSVLSLYFVWKWKYYGICIRSVGIAIVTLTLMYTFTPVRVKPRWSFIDFKYLLKAGLPIYLTGYLALWWQKSVSPTWIVWQFDATTMGFYAFTVFVNSALVIFSSSISQVYYPRLVQNYAQYEDINRLLRLLFKPVALLIPINFCLFIVGWVLIPYLIPILAPKYIGAITAVRCTLFYALVSAFTPMFSVFYVIKRPLLYLACIGAGITAHVGALFFFEQCTKSLVAVITAGLVGQMVYVFTALTVLYTFGKNAVKPLDNAHEKCL